MVRSSLYRLAIATAVASVGTAGAQAHEAYQWEPESALAGSTTQSSPAISEAEVLATPLRVGEATQWVDFAAGAMKRNTVVADARQARQKGLLDDTGEAGATERVLTQRETFNQQERDRILAEWAEADEARRLAVAQQESDGLLALLLIDETEPSNAIVRAYAPNDVNQWQATPVDTPHPTLPIDVPAAALAPAPSSELQLVDTLPAADSPSQANRAEVEPDTAAAPLASHSDGLDSEQ